MELRHVLASIALNFDIEFAPGETGEKFENNAKDTFVLSLDPLYLVFKERKR